MEGVLSRAENLSADELDAVVACLYGLSEPQLIHIFKTFHKNWDFEVRLKRTLNHFHQISGTG